MTTTVQQKPIKLTTYPETYLHVIHPASGEEWIMPLQESTPLVLRDLIIEWIAVEFDNELALDGEIMPGLDGQYYARIMTDGRPPASTVCWAGAGFFTKCA